MIKINILNILVKNKIRRIPLAYILKHKYFYNYEFKLKEFVLIPRSDSELLINILSNFSIHKFLNYALDLGTGCGSIALSFISKFENISFLAVDKSYDVLNIANKNAFSVNKKKIKFIYSNWFNSLFRKESYNLLVSNPPYLSGKEIKFFSSQIEFEPLYALKVKNGIKDLYHIVRTSYDFLYDNSFILLEHGYAQSKQIRKALINVGFVNVCTFMDSNDICRVSYGEK